MQAQDTILLVENDLVDVMTIRRAMRDLGMANPLEIAHNGEEGLDYLRDGDNSRPAIVLLDLNMPRMNGIEFLSIVKDDQELRRIPVIIMTTSKEERDRLACFEKSVAGYIVKPEDYDSFLTAFRKVHHYWELSELSA